MVHMYTTGFFYFGELWPDVVRVITTPPATPATPIIVSKTKWNSGVFPNMTAGSAAWDLMKQCTRVPLDPTVDQTVPVGDLNYYRLPFYQRKLQLIDEWSGCDNKCGLTMPAGAMTPSKQSSIGFASIFNPSVQAETYFPFPTSCSTCPGANIAKKEYYEFQVNAFCGSAVSAMARAVSQSGSKPSKEIFDDAQGMNTIMKANGPTQTFSWSYDKYIEQCAPSSCTVSRRTTPTAAATLATVLGIVGGVVSILRAILGAGTGLIGNLIRKRGGRIGGGAMASSNKASNDGATDAPNDDIELAAMAAADPDPDVPLSQA